MILTSTHTIFKLIITLTSKCTCTTSILFLENHMVENPFLRVDKGENVLEVCTRLSVVRYYDLNEFDCFYVVKMSPLVECCRSVWICMIHSATYTFSTSNMLLSISKISECFNYNFSTFNAIVLKSNDI